MPAMPERAFRTSDETTNAQESTGVSRATQEFYGLTRFEPDNANPPARERPSEDAPSRSSSMRQQVAQYQPTQRTASFQEPRPQRATYGRAGVNDDTIYSGVEFDAPTPVNHSMVPHSRHNTMTYPDSAEAYSHRPSRRNTVESAPFQSGRYSNAPRTATQRRTYLPEDHDPRDGEWLDEGTPPRQRGSQKPFGNYYVVHERGDGGNRPPPPPPPEDSLRLPFAGFIKGTVRGRTSLWYLLLKTATNKLQIS